MQNPQSNKNTNYQKLKTKSRISKRQRNRRRNKQKSLNCSQNKTFSNGPFYRSTQRSGEEIWQKAYENAIRWHGEHQSNYWRRAAENLQRENEMLRQQLQLSQVAKSTPDVYYETSDDNEENKTAISVKKEEPEIKDEEIDGEYLEFLQITFKHREELRLKREEEAQEAVDSPELAETPALG